MRYIVPMATTMKGTKAPSARLPQVDAYIASSQPFARPVLEHVREMMHEAVPDVQEAIKWSMPFFLYRGVILGNMAAFKVHCSFGLWGTETVEQLRAEGLAVGGNMGSFGKLTSVKDLPPRKVILTHIRESARKIGDGERTKAWERPKVAKPAIVVPEALTAALKKNKPAADIFAAKGEGWRREYCDWIDSAKREETRTKRVAEAVILIAEGKGRNWKYETC